MKTVFVAKFKKLQQELQRRIRNGVYLPGSRLPSEAEMCAEFHVSTITVRHALELLVQSGEIFKKNGAGSYVCRRPVFSSNDIFPLKHIPAQYRITMGLLNPSPTEELLYKTLAGLFHSENPEMAVDIINLSYPPNPYNDTWLELIARNQLPACGLFYHYGMYVQHNALLPLEKMEGFQQLCGRLHPHAVRKIAASSGHKSVYAIASSMATKAIIVNTDILAAAGIKDPESLPDWDTLYEWTAAIAEYRKKMKCSRIYPFTFGIPSGVGNVVGLLPFLWQDIKDEDFDSSSFECFRSIFDSKQCLRGLRFLKKLISFIPAEERVVSPSRFNIGDVGIYLQFPHIPLLLKEFMQEMIPMKFFAVPPEKKHGCFRNFYGDGNYGIFRNGIHNDKEKEAAWAWICFLFEKQQQYMLSSNMNFPTLKNSGSFMERKYPQLGQMMRETLEHARKQFDFPGVRKCSAAVSDELRQFFLSDTISAQQCVRSIQKKLQKIKIK